MSSSQQSSVPEDRTDSFSAPAMVVHISMILDRGLIDAERTKLKRVEARISEMCIAAGVVIRVCEGKLDGSQRTISFIPGLIGNPFITFTSEHFLLSSEEALLDEFSSKIAEFSRTV